LFVDGSSHRFYAAVHREWRGELGGADCAFRDRGAAGRYRIAVVGDFRLASPGGNPAGRQSYSRCDGVWGLVLLVGLRTWEVRSGSIHACRVLMVASLAWAWGSLYSKHRDKPLLLC